MKLILKRAYTNLSYEKIYEWIKLISITGGSQLVIQIVGITSGILVIRLLPTKEYALYTIANTMLSTMILLADGGISNGIMAQGGKVWNDRKKLGVIIVTGLNLRKKFAIFSLVTIIPVVIYLLLHHGASWKISMLIVIAIIPIFASTISGNLFQIPLKLHQDFVGLQKIQVFANLGRFVTIVSSLFFLPWAFVAVASAVLPQLWANKQIKKIYVKYADINQYPDPIIKNEVIKTVKRVLPGAIYYCLAAQAMIWIVSIMGSTTAVAQIGALGRLGVAFRLFNIVIMALVVPRFARLSGDSKAVIRRYVEFQILIFLLVIFLIFATWFFSDYALLVLGNEYKNLNYEITLVSIDACAYLLTEVAFSLSSCRSIVLSPVISIPCQILLIIIFLSIVPINTLSGIIWLGVYINFSNYVMNLANFLINAKKPSLLVQ